LKRPAATNRKRRLSFTSNDRRWATASSSAAWEDIVPNPIADYLFLASLFVPTTGILLGVVYLLVPSRQRRASHAQAVEAKAHG
jgi:hypothetical protein